jgi:hypothetical protein
MKKDHVEKVEVEVEGKRREGDRPSLCINHLQTPQILIQINQVTVTQASCQLVEVQAFPHHPYGNSNNGTTSK